MLATSLPYKPLFWGGLHHRREVAGEKRAPGEQTASFPPNPAVSPACSQGQGQKQGNGIMPPAPQSHAQPQHHGNEFIDTDGR